MPSEDKNHPKYKVNIVRDNNHNPDKPHWFEVGAVWEGKGGVLTGETSFGRMVLQPFVANSKNQDSE